MGIFKWINNKVMELEKAYTVKECKCGREYRIIFFDPGKCEECAEKKATNG